MSSAAEVTVQGEEATSIEATDQGAAIIGRSPTQIAIDRLRHDIVAMVCFGITMLIIVLAIAAPLICNWMHITWDVGGKYALDGATATDAFNLPLPQYGPPYGSFTFSHPLGIAPNTATDNTAYLLYGLRDSLMISFVATFISTLLGLAIGLMGGFSRGWLDRILSFVTDLFLSFPYILFFLAVAPIVVQRYATDQAALQRAQLFTLMFLLSVLSWMGLARLIRGQVLSMREREFVLAAQVIGASTWRILVREMIPNLIATLVVVISLSIPAFIAAEVGLSFLGIGLTGLPSMGQMIQAAQNYYDTYPLFLWAPVGTLTILVVALNLLGDSVRDAFDPKTRR